MPSSPSSRTPSGSPIAPIAVVSSPGSTTTCTPVVARRSLTASTSVSEAPGVITIITGQAASYGPERAGCRGPLGGVRSSGMDRRGVIGCAVGIALACAAPASAAPTWLAPFDLGFLTYYVNMGPDGTTVYAGSVNVAPQGQPVSL